MTPEHLPERYYSECNMHSLPNEWADEADSLTDDEYFNKYEEYWDAHFYINEDHFITCEDSFIGICCAVCSEEADGAIPWPCPEAVIYDYVVEKALQKSQNPLHDLPRPEILIKTG